MYEHQQNNNRYDYYDWISTCFYHYYSSSQHQRIYFYLELLNVLRSYQVSSLLILLFLQSKLNLLQIIFCNFHHFLLVANPYSILKMLINYTDDRDAIIITTTIVVDCVTTSLPFHWKILIELNFYHYLVPKMLVKNKLLPYLLSDSILLQATLSWSFFTISYSYCCSY